MSSPKSAATKDARKPQNAGKKSQTKGRPSDYSDDLAGHICGLIASGQSLVEICKADDMPHVVTVYRWLAKHEEFRNMYTHAREDQAETHADEIVKIADEAPPNDMNGKTDSGYVAWQRNRIDARKWVAAKLKPKKYGDKQTVEHEGGVTLNVVTGVSDDD